MSIINNSILQMIHIDICLYFEKYTEKYTFDPSQLDHRFHNMTCDGFLNFENIYKKFPNDHQVGFSNMCNVDVSMGIYPPVTTRNIIEFIKELLRYTHKTSIKLSGIIRTFRQKVIIIIDEITITDSGVTINKIIDNFVRWTLPSYEYTGNILGGGKHLIKWEEECV